MVVFWLVVLALVLYFSGQVAYARGRKDKWEEMCKDYICIHKSVCIIPVVKENGSDKKEVKKEPKVKKITQKKLDKKPQKIYNRKTYNNQGK